MPHPVRTAVLVTSGLSASALLLLLYLKRKKRQEPSDDLDDIELDSLRDTAFQCDVLAAEKLLTDINDLTDFTDLTDLADQLDLPEVLSELSNSPSSKSQSPKEADEECEQSTHEQPLSHSKSASIASSEAVSEFETFVGDMTEQVVPAAAESAEEAPGADNNNDQTVANNNNVDDEVEAVTEEAKRLTVGNESAEPPAGSESAEMPAGSESAEMPAGSQSAEPPAGSQSAEMPAGSESAEMPAGNESAEPAAGNESSDLTVDCDRVNKWLAKNEPFSQAGGSRPTEESSDDSGRPSSVDTETTSPRAARHSSQPQSSPADRTKVIRGVSPVPGDDNDIIHQFLIPNKLGGSMVGTRGRNINYIRAKSGASVWISRNFFDKKTQVVNVRGPIACVKNALQVIKKRFPELDVKPINTAVPIQRNPALQPTMCQLSLPVGVLVDVNVCAMCRGTTLFMQQPTHPSFHHLEKMDYTIMKHYADHNNVPALPRPVNPGAVCVAPFGSAWYRAIIADVYPEDDMVLMKYLDWGGYERMPVGCLKQIRTEMMHLPFQAVEGHLAYVSPLLDADADTEPQLEELSHTIHERYLGSGKRVKCQFVYYNDVGQPCVYLYSRDSSSEPWRFVQEELVQAGLVQWFQMPHVPPQMPQT